MKSHVPHTPPEPAALAAALPGLIDCYPRNCLVVVTGGLNGPGTSPHLRVPIAAGWPDSAGAGLRGASSRWEQAVVDLLNALGQTLQRWDVRHAYVFIVTDEAEQVADWLLGEVADLTVELFGARDIAVSAVAITSEISAGAVIRTVPCEPRSLAVEYGQVADPHASPLVQLQALRGRSAARSLEQIQARFARRAADHVRAPLAAVPSRPRGEATWVGDLEEMLEISALPFYRGGGAQARFLAGARWALGDHVARDILVISVGQRDRAAQAVAWWEYVARSAEVEYAGPAAALAALGYYLLGSGVAAGVAADIAAQHCPENRFVVLVHAAIRAGLRPDFVLDLAETSTQLAARWGLDPNLDDRSAGGWHLAGEAGLADDDAA